MTLDNSHFNISPFPPRFDSAVEKLSRLQTELMSDALKRAVDDAGAAMMHQISEPLTALLLYLHEIKRAGQAEGAGSVSAALCEIVDMALLETERVCEIIERAGKAVEASIDSEAAVARGREAIDAWAWNNRIKAGGSMGSPPHRANPHPLTPREHEVLALITGGSSNKEGGHRLGISTRTFEAHRAHLMGKLGARNAADLVRLTLGNNQ
jgi:DNA-binding CsgD family transcriptional regulator